MTILKVTDAKANRVIWHLKDDAVKVDGLLQSAVFESPIPGIYTVYFLPSQNIPKKEITQIEMEKILDDLRY